MDRNGLGFGYLRDDFASLSARRAWIEIESSLSMSCSVVVALRKESVDRNIIATMTLTGLGVALRKESVDRNYYCDHDTDWIRVALRKESVDRNKYVVQCRKVMGGRSPQGERG